MSNKCFNFSFGYFNSGGDILYGEMDIGQISGIMSIRKSISLSRGTLGYSTWKTSGNSFTIGNDWMGGTLVHKSLTWTKL